MHLQNPMSNRSPLLTPNIHWIFSRTYEAGKIFPGSSRDFFATFWIFLSERRVVKLQVVVVTLGVRVDPLI